MKQQSLKDDFSVGFIVGAVTGIVTTFVGEPNNELISLP